jgi:hypothetical protein
VVDDEMSRAVVTFLGSPGVLDATEPEDRVRALLGERAFDVLPRIQAMLADLYSAALPSGIGDLPEMARHVERWLSENHPELDANAVRAVANTYTFDWK